jgi:beta-fructofuranosidase
VRTCSAWELQLPVTAPGGFGELEVAQVRVVDGQAMLVFTCQPDKQSADQLAEFGRFST